MISERGGFKELQIFDYFEIDKNLPKHKKVVEGQNPFDANSIAVGDGWGGAVPTNSNSMYDETNLRYRIGNWLLRRKVKTYKKKITVI